MKNIIYWQDPSTIPLVAQLLRAGRVVIGASDTVLGLLAPCTWEGFQALNMIKGRQEKPYLILIKSADVIDSLVMGHKSFHIENIIAQCWPGPLTILLRAHPAVPAYMKSKTGVIALRVPRHDGLQGLLDRCERLFSTSANYTGDPVPMTIEELDVRIATAAELIVLDKKGDVPLACLPSTIIDCTESDVKLVREGAYPVAEIERIIGKRLV